jgi:hypothetical protein
MVAEICIEDIAYALSGINRYSGHTRYSVAQHSVLMAEHMPSRSLGLQALLHDAAEAYCQDLPRPMKVARLTLEGRPDCSYDRIEALMDSAIAERFCLARPLPQAIKRADLRMLATEYRDLGFRDTARRRWQLPSRPYPEKIDLWTADEARDFFLGSYADFT